jgi:hypothetical protein
MYVLLKLQDGVFNEQENGQKYDKNQLSFLCKK